MQGDWLVGVPKEAVFLIPYCLRSRPTDYRSSKGHARKWAESASQARFHLVMAELEQWERLSRLLRLRFGERKLVFEWLGVSSWHRQKYRALNKQYKYGEQFSVAVHKNNLAGIQRTACHRFCAKGTLDHPILALRRPEWWHMPRTGLEKWHVQWPTFRGLALTMKSWYGLVALYIMHYQNQYYYLREAWSPLRPRLRLK